MKRGVVITSIFVSLVVLLTISFVSAGFFDDFFQPKTQLSPPSLTSSYYDGLPDSFEPILAYTHNHHPNGRIVALWDKDGRIFLLSPNGNSFREFTSSDKADWNLDGFKAIAGYSHTFNGDDKEIIGLWDKDGNIKFSVKGDIIFQDFDENLDSDGDGVSDREEQGLLGFSAILGYTNFLNGPDKEIIGLWDKNGDVKVSAKGDDGFRDYEGDERKDQGLKTVVAVEGYYHPHLNTVYLWDDDTVLDAPRNDISPRGKGLFKWDWSLREGLGEFVSVTPSGLPLGVPDAAYYDAEKRVVIVWFGNTAYQSLNGINFYEVERDEGGGTTCTDSDGGINYHVRGQVQVTDSAGIIVASDWDDCSFGTTILEEELYCENNEGKAIQYDCATEGKVCSGGRCVEEDLICSASSCIIEVGYFVTIEVEEVLYEISISFVDNTKTILIVNGETTNSLRRGESFELSSGLIVKVLDILSQEVTGGIRQVTFSLSPGETPREDDCVADADCAVGERCFEGRCFALPIPPTEICSSGTCELDETCFDDGRRLISSGDRLYCDGPSQDFLPQVGEGGSCQNNFQCTTNLCVEDECRSVSGIVNIICWFLHPFSEDRRNECRANFLP